MIMVQVKIISSKQKEKSKREIAKEKLKQTNLSSSDRLDIIEEMLDLKEVKNG